MDHRHHIAGLGLALLLAGALAAPALAVTVSVESPDTTVVEDAEFALRIATTEFADLKGFDVIFKYDPTKLRFLGADPGDVLTGPGYPFFAYVVPDFDAPADSAWYDAAVGVGSAHGPGILAFYRFKALAVGESPIQCEFVDFRDSANERYTPDCVSGLVRITAAVPVSPATWGRIKILYR